MAAFGRPEGLRYRTRIRITVAQPFRAGRHYGSAALQGLPRRPFGRPDAFRGVSVISAARGDVAALVEQLGVVAVIRMKDPAKLRAVVDAIAAGGVRALEVTMTVPRAVDMIRELAPTLPPGFLLGAGTVIDAATARAVIDAGASFVVSPVFRPDVVAACHEREVPAMPGCFRPTEIHAGPSRRAR